VKRRPLALTDVQLQQIKASYGDAAGAVARRLLAAVARRLAGIPNPTNDDVAAATVAVLGGLGIDIPTSVFLCDAAPTEEADHGPT
jgi:hypothetical protein